MKKARVLASASTQLVPQRTCHVDFVLYSLLFTLYSLFTLNSILSQQTNLMVLAPGDYKFLDYAKFGLPLQLAMVIVSVAMAMVTADFYVD